VKITNKQRFDPICIACGGGQTRDFVFVQDVVAANVFAASKAGLTGVFNVGYGGSVTIRDLAERIVAQTGATGGIVFEAPRAGDVRHSRASADKLQAAGWRPGYDLKSGLSETLEWYRTNSLPV